MAVTNKGFAREFLLSRLLVDKRVVGRGVTLCLAGALIIAIMVSWTRTQLPGATYLGVHGLRDLLLLLVLLTGGTAYSHFAPRAGAALSLIVTFIWALAYISQLQFLIKTGTFASRPLIAYSITHSGTVSSVALSGLDGVFCLKLALAVTLIVTAFVAKPIHTVLSRDSILTASVWLAAIIAVSATLIPVQTGGLTGPLFNGGLAGDLPPVLNPAPAYRAPSLAAVQDGGTYPDVVILIVESGRSDLVDLESLSPRPVFINRIARESVTFKRAYTTTSHTSKALVGILCGHYPHPDMWIIEATPGGLPLDCLPKILAGVGYQTYFLQAALGAFENRPGLTKNLGFEKTIVQEDLSPSFAKAGYLGMDERALLDPLEEIVRTRDRSRPFFMTLLTSLSHHPYAMPGQAMPEEAAPYAYGTAIEYVDGVLAEAYARMGRHLDWDNTVLVLMGDHGEAFAEHGLQQHDSVSYEEVVKIPLMIRYPARFAPRADTWLRQSIDIAPTVLGLAKIGWEGEIAGESLLVDPGRSRVVTSCWPTRTCHSVVFENGLKVVYHFGEAAEEVYDLRSDPRERVDLARRAGANETIFQAAEEIARTRWWAESPYR